MNEFNALWEKVLDERQLNEVSFARLYAAEFHHGTDGHNRLMLIDIMAKMLDRVCNEHGITLEQLKD